MALLCGALILGVAEPVAQSPGKADLAGRVLDEAGEPLPGALVTLTNPGVAIGSPTVVTDAEGRYVFRTLPPGRDFSLRVFIVDFATVIAGPFELQADRETRLDLTLKRSSELEETVRVEARGEIVDTASTATGVTYTAEFIEGLPLVGRRFQDVLTLAPGVTDTDGDGNPNVRGARDTGLQLRLDGTNITDPLTGKIGQDINLEAIEDVQIITAGAPAEYGRADGGFASVITKSGGNDVEGSFKVFFRSDFLDGDGAHEEGSVPEFHKSDIFFTLGGPVVRDHLWYFATIQRLDEEEPVPFADGGFGMETREGWRGFGKLTWQVDADNKLALQLNYDPLEVGGNHIGPRIDPETDFLIRSGGPLPQLTWTATLSPSLLMQSMVSRLSLDAELAPVSEEFRQIEVTRARAGSFNDVVLLPCVIRNCTDEPGLHRFFRVGGGPRRVGPQHEAGPYHFQSSVDLSRATLRSDLSYSVEDRLGQHAIKSGFEGNVETYAEAQVNNPVMTDETMPSPTAPDVRVGEMFLQVFDPVNNPASAEGLSLGVYAQDGWKLRPNLVLNVGLRLDHEEVDSQGDTDFDPLAESREALRRFNIVCDAADLAGQACSQKRTPGRIGPGLSGIVTPPPGHPALQFDLNGDGKVDISGPEAALISIDPFTSAADLTRERFTITNNNLAPRLSVSWDPWNDGKTKLFGSWGKYYDRLFLGSVVTGQDARFYTATWLVSSRIDQAEPGERSEPLRNAVSISQTDRELATPYTIEWTAGIERELAPEWAVGLTFVSRRATGLLQDVDVNHITCAQFGDAYGVPPYAVCGDGGFLEMDRFGDLRYNAAGTESFSFPNGAPDLYHHNPFFNQVLRVGNFNESRYDSIDLTLRKRLHRNWQMLLGYTYSKARGEAESFENAQGNDPAISDKISGYLDYDQRHVVKWQAVAHLPHDIVLGGTIDWGAGLPYSFISTVSDADDTGLTTPQRIFSITGEKNDQRNEAVLMVGAHVEKRFILGRNHISGFLDVQNLLNTNDLRLLQVDDVTRATVEGVRDFGRRFQLGMFIQF